MGLIDTLKDWWSRDAARYVVHDLPASAVRPAGDTGERCVAGSHYFRLWLSEMRLARDREWFASRHPVVHALVKLTVGDTVVELPRIAGPMALPGLDAAHLGDVIQLDHPLTPLLPYNGGVVELSAGLIALEGTNLVRDFAAAVGAITQIVAQPPVSTALAAVGPIATAVQTLLASTAGHQHLGVHLAFAGDQAPRALHAGYLAVVRQDGAVVATADLAVLDGVLHHRAAPLAGADYLLFRIERMAERDDWDRLSPIAGPFREALSALSLGSTEMAQAHVRRAMLEAWHSPDLTRVDRTRVSAEIKRAFEDARNSGLGLARVTPSLADAMATAPTTLAFAAAQPPTLGQLLTL